MALKCHSAFVHYNMYHNNHCHGGGNNYGSIFNITNNCNGGHTGFWGGLGAGLGFGFGGMLMGLLGGFGNMLGGFGMSGLWGAGNGDNGADRDYSQYSSHRSRRSSCDCDCKDKVKEVDPTDADCKKIADFQEEINKFQNDIKTLTKEDIEAKYSDIKARIEAAKTESEKDDKNKDANLKSYAKLLEALEIAKESVKVEKPPVPPVKIDPDLDFEVDSKDYLPGFDDCTDEDLAKLSGSGVKLARDVVGYNDGRRVRDVEANYASQKYVISSDGKEIKLYDKDIKGSDGQVAPVTYSFVGKTQRNQMVYKDSNGGGQLYLLQKNGTEYRLVQYNGMQGSGKAAHSSSRVS